MGPNELQIDEQEMENLIYLPIILILYYFKSLFLVSAQCLSYKSLKFICVILIHTGNS